MSMTLRPGTFFNVTPRPPIRLADPGRICMDVTPPASAVTKPGILWPDAVFGPDLGRNGRGHFVAVRMRFRAR